MIFKRVFLCVLFIVLGIVFFMGAQPIRLFDPAMPGPIGGTTPSTGSFTDGTFTGNVGIGTTTPSQKLDVSGNININEGSAYMYDGFAALKLAKGADTWYANTFVGQSAGNAAAYRQTALGYLAGQQNTGGQQTALGYFAGHQNTGNQQTAIGYLAGHQNTGGHQTALGYLAGYINTGAQQTAIGYAAGQQNTGSHQTAIGYAAGQQNTGGQQTALGYLAGHQNTGDRVIGIGFETTRNNSANDVVAIGYRAGKDNSASNQFIVKQANVSAVPLIQGDFATGNVGIGTTTPDRRQHVEVSGAQTAVTTYVKKNTYITTGTAAALMGVGEEFELEDAGGTNRIASTNETQWSDATNGKSFVRRQPNAYGASNCYTGEFAEESIDGTSKTLIPNGTGDVTSFIGVFYAGKRITGGQLFSGNAAVAPAGTTDLYTDGGTNVLTLTVAADGSVTVARSAGADTYDVIIQASWK